jgi:alpha-tubulin suppressor-like RCC1 family protein
MQLSHGDNVAASQTHKQAIFEPITITREIGSHRVTHVDGGSDFSTIISENGRGDQYFWGTGNNLRGQIGNSMTTHFHDMEPMHFEDEPIEPVKFEFLS